MRLFPLVALGVAGAVQAVSNAGGGVLKGRHLVRAVSTIARSSSASGSATTRQSTNATTTLATPSATLTKVPILTTAVATSKPSQFLLDPSFDITNIPTVRQYYFVIDARKGSPDGRE